MFDNKIITFPIKMTEHVHKIISQAAENADMTRQDYILQAVGEKIDKDKTKEQVR